MRKIRPLNIDKKLCVKCQIELWLNTELRVDWKVIDKLNMNGKLHKWTYKCIGE